MTGPPGGYHCQLSNFNTFTPYANNDVDYAADLSKQLLEVVIGQLGEVRQGRQGGIIAHGPQGFGPSLHHGQQQHLQGLLGVAEGFQGLQDAVQAHHLTQPQLAVILLDTVLARASSSATCLCSQRQGLSRSSIHHDDFMTQCSATCLGDHRQEGQAAAASLVTSCCVGADLQPKHEGSCQLQICTSRGIINHFFPKGFQWLRDIMQALHPS